MSSHSDNKYTVNQRIAALTTRVTELESALKALRVVLLADLQNYLDAHCHGQNGADGRDGIDGSPGAPGAQGERGDITVVGDAELQAAVKDLRRKLKEQHAAHIAVIIESIEGQKKGNASGQHFAKLLESIKRDIENLR